MIFKLTLEQAEELGTLIKSWKVNLKDLKQAKIKTFGQLIYELAGEQGKVSMDKNRNLVCKPLAKKWNVRIEVVNDD